MLVLRPYSVWLNGGGLPLTIEDKIDGSCLPISHSGLPLCLEGPDMVSNTSIYLSSSLSSGLLISQGGGTRWSTETALKGLHTSTHHNGPQLGYVFIHMKHVVYLWSH